MRSNFRPGSNLMMANPLGSNNRLSPEEYVELCTRKACSKCGVESSGQRFMVCGGCEGPSYCSKECQRADWPAHKPACKATQAIKAKLQARGDGEIAEQFDDWVNHRKMPLGIMMCGMLGKQAHTHVLRITVDHQPTGQPPFKAIACKTVPIEELPPQMADGVRTGLQNKPPSVDGEAGCAILDCPAIKYSVVHFGPVYEDVSKPQYIPMCLELLNMDVDEAMAMATTNKTG